MNSILANAIAIGRFLIKISPSFTQHSSKKYTNCRFASQKILTKLYRSGCGLNLLLVRVPRKLDASSVKEEIDVSDSMESYGDEI